MKILKSRISKSVLIAAYYITLVVIFRTPVLSDLSIETIKTNLFDVSTLVPVFLVGVSYVILSQLYLLHFWSVVLIILAIIGTGIEKTAAFCSSFRATYYTRAYGDTFSGDCILVI